MSVVGFNRPGKPLTVDFAVKNARSLPKRRAPHSRLQVYDRPGDAKIFGGYVTDDVKRSQPTYPHGANILAQTSMRAGVCPFSEEEKFRASSCGTEREGREFQSEPCSCAGSYCTKLCRIVRSYASQGVSLIGRPRLPRVGVNSSLTETTKVGSSLWSWWPHRKNLGRASLPRQVRGCSFLERIPVREWACHSNPGPLTACRS